ncbi:DUF6630 family protein, partial [Prevotella fusca]|uniref:DUF6630 family protein n=1 Tax=Prevotella fusca TaxID=589436 RepID=UPI003F9F9BCB
KCFEDFVSQALGFLTRNYAAELREESLYFQKQQSMKDKITNGCIYLFIYSLPFAFGWCAYVTFQDGLWFLCFIMALVALFFLFLILVSIFFKPAPQEPSPEELLQRIMVPEREEELLAFAQKVAGEDKELMQMVKESLQDPIEFYRQQEKRTQNRYIADIYYEMLEYYQENLEELNHFTLPYLLYEYKALGWLARKEDEEDIVSKIQSLQRVIRHHLPIPELDMSIYYDVPNVLLCINEEWKTSGYQIALIDEDSSDYWIAIIPLEYNN